MLTVPLEPSYIRLMIPNQGEINLRLTLFWFRKCLARHFGLDWSYWNKIKIDLHMVGSQLRWHCWWKMGWNATRVIANGYCKLSSHHLLCVWSIFIMPNDQYCLMATTRMIDNGFNGNTFEVIPYKLSLNGYGHIEQLRHNRHNQCQLTKKVYSFRERKILILHPTSILWALLLQDSEWVQTQLST